MSTILRHKARKMGIAIRRNGFVSLNELVPRLKTIRKLGKRTHGSNTSAASGSCVSVQSHAELVPTHRMSRDEQAAILRLLQKIVLECKKQRFTLRQVDEVRTKAASASPASTATPADISVAGALPRNMSALHGTNKPCTNILAQWEIRANQGHTMRLITVEDHRSILDPDELPVCIHGTYQRHVQAILEKGLNRMKRHHIHMAPGLVGDTDPISGRVIISGMRHDCDTIIRVDVARAMRTHGLEFFCSSNGVVLCPGDQNGAIPPDCLKVESMDMAKQGGGTRHGVV